MVGQAGECGGGLAPRTSTTMLRALGADALSPRWTEFAARYLPLMEATLKRSFPTLDADDVIQETLVALVRIMPDYRYDPDEKGHFRNYLVGIVKNKAREHLRARMRYAERKAKVGKGLSVMAATAAKEAKEAETESRLDWQRSVYEVALMQLMANPKIQERTKQIFRRVALNGESPESVARIFGVTRNGVDQIRNRLLGELRELVAGLMHA